MGIKKDLGARIKKLRKQKKFTQEQFAELIDIAPRTLYGIEAGRNFVTAETLDKIISVLNINAEDLFFDENSLSPKEMADFIKTETDKLQENPKKIILLYKITKYLSDL